MNKQFFGEIVSSTLTNWTIACWQLDNYPPFGALIQADYNNKQHFGIVCDIQTGPKDSGRTPFAFGKTVEQLQQEQPHIFQLLHSTVTCIPVSYVQTGKLIYEIPKQPAPIHTFAQICNAHDMQNFFSSSQWVTTFFNLAQQNPLFDELFIALLRNGYEHKALNPHNIAQIIDIFSLLTHDDYRKLKIFLQRIEGFVH